MKEGAHHCEGAREGDEAHHELAVRVVEVPLVDPRLQQGRGSHTLPALLTRFNAPGFPLLHCKIHLAIGDADADMRDAKCTDETSGNVCNAPLRAP